MKGTVFITAIEGKDLAPKDSNGKSDPYVKILLLGSKSKKGIEQKTKYIEKTLSPTWNHKFNPIPYDNEAVSALHVTVFDKDMVGSDVFMGQIWIPLYEIRAAGGKLDKWFQLVTNETADNVSGSIHLALEVLTDKEQENEKNRKIEEETKKKMEEQEKMLKILNEKKKEMEEQRNLKMSQTTQTKLMNNLPPPIHRVGNATCVVPFVGQSETELSMNEGDDITVEDRSDPNWWYATNHTSNRQGYVPASAEFVQFNNAPSTSKLGNATCVLQFVGQSQTELSMNVGDDITVEDRSDPNWWYATNHTSTLQGYIPATGDFVRFN